LENKWKAIKIAPEIISPISSFIPMVKEAVNPMIDQSSGMMNITRGNFLVLNSRRPKVKIVVGQGSPNVGEEGYR